MQGDDKVGDGAGRWVLAERRAALERACAALAGLDEVLYEAGGDQLGPVLELVDRVLSGAELARVLVTGEALARGEIGARGAALSPAQWVRLHAPSTRAGGAGQVVSVATDFATTANAPVVEATRSGADRRALRGNGPGRGDQAAPDAGRRC